MKLRWYQEECVDALYKDLQNPDTKPVGVVPTGGGKTVILCGLIDRIVSNSPNSNILVLAHNAEILEQNHATLESYYHIGIGLYSSGLKSKTVKKVTVAGIQSCYRKVEDFKHFDYIIIDECHLIPMKSNTMYRKFLDALDKQCCGLTATPFRLDHGYITDGEKALFNKVSYNLCNLKNFNRLVDEGYLSRLETKNTLVRMNPELEEKRVKTTAGDWNKQDLSNRYNRDSITESAVEEISSLGKNYKLWLIFAIDISHAENIKRKLELRGIKTACVHSKMKQDRRSVISDIKKGEYKAVVNVDVLTVGFDVPFIDLIALLRPTKSPVIHVQTIGRGLRIHPDKEHCLVLDFAGNTSELGPINDIQVKDKSKKKKGTGEAIMKECPDCMYLNYGAVKFCYKCNHEFVFKEKIRRTSSNLSIVAEESERWCEVRDVTYSIHNGALRVTYNIGLRIITDRIAFASGGYPGHIAKNWVVNRLPEKSTMPKSLNSLYEIAKTLKVPKKIKVDFSTKYNKITDYYFPK